MARFFYTAPEKEIRVVNVDRKGEKYEVWLLSPHLIGTAQVIGPQRILYKGKVFSNMQGPTMLMLMEKEELELAKDYMIKIL